jgi:hypothetical protein
MLLKMSEQVGQPPESLFQAMDETIKEIEKTSHDHRHQRAAADRGRGHEDPGHRRQDHRAGRAVRRVPRAGRRVRAGRGRHVRAGVEAARKIMQVHTDHWPTWEGEAEVRQVMG